MSVEEILKVMAASMLPPELLPLFKVPEVLERGAKAVHAAHIAKLRGRKT